MLADKKKELIPSVESGEGLKSLMGLEAHVRYANNFYNVSVDCESPAQSKYLIQKYAHRYDNSLFQIYPYVIERLNDNKVKIGETGLFLTKKEISLHALLKDFTEEEHMVIQSNTLIKKAGSKKLPSVKQQ